MRNKRLLTLVGSVCVLLILAVLPFTAACPAPPEEPTEPTTPTTPTTPTPPPFEFPEILGISTDELGTTGYAFTLAYTPVMEKHFGVSVRTIPSSTKASSIAQIKAGRAYFIGGWNDVNAALANEGQSEYADVGWGPQKTVGMWYNNSTYYAWVVRGDSDIEAWTADELRGKRFAYYKGSGMWLAAFEASLAFAGLTLDDVELVELGGYSPIARGVAEGKADVVFLATTSSVTFEIAENPFGVRVIPLPSEDKEGWKRFQEISPYGNPAIVDMGIPASIGVEAIVFDYTSSTILDVDEELIYRVCKFMDEAYTEYKDLHPNCVNMSREKTAAYIKRTGIPFHPGAVRYFKEIGIWTAEDDTWNNERIGWFDLYQDAWQKALADASGQQITVSYNSEAWLKLWASYYEELPRFSGR